MKKEKERKMLTALEYFPTTIFGGWPLPLFFLQSLIFRPHPVRRLGQRSSFDLPLQASVSQTDFNPHEGKQNDLMRASRPATLVVPLLRLYVCRCALYGGSFFASSPWLPPSFTKRAFFGLLPFPLCSFPLCVSERVFFVLCLAAPSE